MQQSHMLAGDSFILCPPALLLLLLLPRMKNRSDWLDIHGSAIMPMVQGIIARRLGTKEWAISILSYSAIKGKMLHPNHNLPNLLLLNYYVQEITPFRKDTGKSKAHSRGTSPSSTFPPLAGGCSRASLPALIENTPSPHPAMPLCLPSGTQHQLCSSESSRQLDNRKPTWTALMLAL